MRSTAGGPGSIGILGGTFDPVHFGHLRSAFELMVRLSLDEVRFIPCRIPPHRDLPVAPLPVRLTMLQNAIAACRRFRVDERELDRDGPSYTVTTLASLRAEYPAIPLCLFLGMDAFENLPGWHRWREVLGLSHIVVAHRPGWSVPRQGELGELLAGNLASHAGELQESPAGRIFIHPVTQLEIASTRIRQRVRNGEDPCFLVPQGVRNIILESGCYRSASRNS